MKMDKLLESWNYVQLVIREKATFSSRYVCVCVCVCVRACACVRAYVCVYAFA